MGDVSLGPTSVSTSPAGIPRPQGDDDLGEHLLTGGLGAAAVGGHDLLTDPPARLDFDIII